MRCPELREWMSLKLDGRLSAAQQTLFDAHLASCPTCVEEWARWQRIGDLFGGAPVLAPAEDLTARVMARIERQPQRRHLWSSVLVLTLGVAVLAALFVAPVVASMYSMAAGASTPGMLGIAVSLGVHCLGIVWALVDAGRLVLWAIASSPSTLAALVYALVAAGALGFWLRVAVSRPVTVPEEAEPPDV